MGDYMKTNYNLSNPDVTKALKEALETQDDSVFVGPAIVEIKAFSKAMTNKAHFLYEFARRPSFSPPPPGLGPKHGDEQIYVFGFEKAWETPPKAALTPDEIKTSNIIVDFWTSFAKTGNPISNGTSIVWKEFKDIEPNYTILKETVESKLWLNKRAEELYRYMLTQIDGFVPS